MEPSINNQINSLIKDVDNFLSQNHYTEGTVNPLKISYFGKDTYGAHLKSPHHFGKRHEFYTKDVRSLVEKIRKLTRSTIDYKNEVKNQAFNDLTFTIVKLNSEVNKLQQDLDQNFSENLKYRSLKETYERASKKLANLGSVLLEIQTTENPTIVKEHLDNLVPPLSKQELKEEEVILTLSKNVKTAQKQIFSFLRDFLDSLPGLLKLVATSDMQFLGDEDSQDYINSKSFLAHKSLIENFNLKVRNSAEIIHFLIDHKEVIDPESLEDLTHDLSTRLDDFREEVDNLAIPRGRILREDYEKISKKIGQFLDFLEELKNPSTDSKTLNEIFNTIEARAR